MEVRSFCLAILVRSTANSNLSLAEVTTIILCGCLPVVPKFFQLFLIRSKSGSASQNKTNSYIALAKHTPHRTNSGILKTTDVYITYPDKILKAVETAVETM